MEKVEIKLRAKCPYCGDVDEKGTIRMTKEEEEIVRRFLSAAKKLFEGEELIYIDDDYDENAIDM